MTYLTDSFRDAALDYIQDAAAAGNVDLHICSTEALTYAQATSTYTLGNKADITITGPAEGDVSGRKISIGAITGGSVTATGTATHLCLVDTSTSELLLTEELSSSQSVTLGNTFTLTAFDIEFPDFA